MKEKVFNLFIIIISLFILGELLIKKRIVYASVIYALNIWVHNLIPILFPFFIISDILINYNITTYIPKIIKKICKRLFNISDNMLTILLLSMISGFPSNARNTRTLYDKGMINLEEANHILIFSHFANPVFILTTVGVFFLHSERVGIIILISHYLSNIILGVLFREKNNYFVDCGNSIIMENNFGNVFVGAIKKAIDTILLICGILVVFMLLSEIILSIINVNIYNQMIIKGLFEITIGVETLSRLNINVIYKAVIVSIFLSFGGISVHIQVLSQITETKIRYIYFFIGRMYQTIISVILTYIICLLFNI